ncbi:MAG: hypothetical protein ACP5N0_00255 [Methanosarcina sp.]
MKKNNGGFGINEGCDENLLCIPFSEEQIAEIKKYAALNEMGVEEFLKNVCLNHCLQQMDYIYGQRAEAPEAGGGAAKSENGSKTEQKKIEIKGKKPNSSSKDLLDGPLVLDQQCIMDLFAIKREFGHTSNDKIITIALKLGLNQLSVALDMLKHKLEEK